MAPGDKKGGGGGKSDEARRSRSRSPLDGDKSDGGGSSSLLTIDEMKSMMAEVMSASMPKIIIEASKVAREGLAVDNETSRQMAKDMRLLKQGQEEIAQTSKAALLKSEGLSLKKMSSYERKKERKKERKRIEIISFLQVQKKKKERKSMLTVLVTFS